MSIQRCIKRGKGNINIYVSFCNNFHFSVFSFAFVINFWNCKETLWTTCTSWRRWMNARWRVPTFWTWNFHYWELKQTTTTTTTRARLMAWSHTIVKHPARTHVNRRYSQFPIKVGENSYGIRVEDLHLARARIWKSPAPTSAMFAQVGGRKSSREWQRSKFREQRRTAEEAGSS